MANARVNGGHSGVSPTPRFFLSPIIPLTESKITIDKHNVTNPDLLVSKPFESGQIVGIC